MKTENPNPEPDPKPDPKPQPRIRWCEKHHKFTHKCGCVEPGDLVSTGVVDGPEFDPDVCLEEMRVLAKRITRTMGSPGELPDITDAVELADRVLRLDKCLDNLGRLPVRWMRTRAKEDAFVDDPARPLDDQWGE